MHQRLPSLILSLALIVPGSLLAHGGGLDRNGCHTNRKTGEYHCHGASRGVSPVPRLDTPPAPERSSISVSFRETGGKISDRELVLTTQLLLTTLGYEVGRADGILGLTTALAIRQFQTAEDLEPDGKPSGPLLVRLSQAVLRASRQ